MAAVRAWFGMTGLTVCVWIPAFAGMTARYAEKGFVARDSCLIWRGGLVPAFARMTLLVCGFPLSQEWRRVNRNGKRQPEPQAPLATHSSLLNPPYALRENRGSSVSRKPSPTKFMDRTLNDRNRPGKNVTQTAIWR